MVTVDELRKVGIQVKEEIPVKLDEKKCSFIYLQSDVESYKEFHPGNDFQQDFDKAMNKGDREAMCRLVVFDKSWLKWIMPHIEKAQAMQDREFFLDLGAAIKNCRRWHQAKKNSLNSSGPLIAALLKHVHITRSQNGTKTTRVTRMGLKTLLMEMARDGTLPASFNPNGLFNQAWRFNNGMRRKQATMLKRAERILANHGIPLAPTRSRPRSR